MSNPAVPAAVIGLPEIHCSADPRHPGAGTEIVGDLSSPVSGSAKTDDIGFGERPAQQSTPSHTSCWVALLASAIRALDAQYPGSKTVLGPDVCLAIAVARAVIAADAIGTATEGEIAEACANLATALRRLREMGGRS